jgi:hypothetical protein
MLEIVPVPLLEQDRAAFADSCTRLRSLQPDYPRAYAVAAVAEEGRRRWWQLASGVRNGRIEIMYSRAIDDLGVRDRASDVVAMSLIHAIVGRVVALLVLEGRAWDPGLENLWIHNDSDGGIDWAGLADTRLRVLPGDPWADRPGVVTLPCEEALIVWLAHRCGASLTAVYECLSGCTGFDADRFWGMVGEAVLGASTHVPILARSMVSPIARTGARPVPRRGQAFLDAMTARGLPVRQKGVA